MSRSYDSGQRPLSDVHYQQAGNPYGDPTYTQSGTLYPQKKRGLSNWVKFGVPVLILVIIGAVVGAVLGVRASRNSSSSSSNNGGSGGNNGPPPDPDDVASAKSQVGRFATATNTAYIPVYPSATNAAAYSTPTFLTNAATWPEDDFQPAQPNPEVVRPDRPRIIAPKYKWDALPQLMQTDPYLRGWHDTIMQNASLYFAAPPVRYNLDGGNGILDNAREVKQRIKSFAYAYRMTSETRWVDRAWTELVNAAGNSTTSPWGQPGNPDLWNVQHFLDVAELTAAFGIAYDWLHDIWRDEQRNAIMWSIINLGLNNGANAYRGVGGYNWWQGSEITGNWNCVCNGGLTIGALAILGDDPTGVSNFILQNTIPNALQACVNAPSPDGTWTETPDYWYFGTTGHAEMSSALLTATGSDYGLLSRNPSFNLTSLFHIYVTGATSMFQFGDSGPNKFSTTANSLIHYSSQFRVPTYMLYQRDRNDAPEPWSMFWYDPAVAGAWWNGLPLDRYFDDPSTRWVSMRSSWTDTNALYVAMKSSQLRRHQAHGDLDCGTFVIDALGQRWAGEYGNSNYLSTEYFNSEDQNAVRWVYYRKATEGQNTILINKQNQLVTADPTGVFGTSGTSQGSSTVINVPDNSNVFFLTDMSSAYLNSVKRGIRLLNRRQQVLLQDEIAGAEAEVQWRMQTNATITTNGASATLNLNGETMEVQLLNPPPGAEFSVLPARRFDSDPPLPTAAGPNDLDPINDPASVLAIVLPAGSYTLQVLFNPQWPGLSGSDYVTPPSVPLDQWTVDSHNA